MTSPHTRSRIASVKRLGNLDPASSEAESIRMALANASYEMVEDEAASRSNWHCPECQAELPVVDTGSTWEPVACCPACGRQD